MLRSATGFVLRLLALYVVAWHAAALVLGLLLGDGFSLHGYLSLLKCLFRPCAELAVLPQFVGVAAVFAYAVGAGVAAHTRRRRSRVS